jgi:hypothetical protein
MLQAESIATKSAATKMCASTSSLDDLENMIKTAKENENA